MIRESISFCWLLSADVLLFNLGQKWMYPFGVNGPWPLCGHMQPSPLLLDHVQDGLPENGSRGFYSMLNSMVNTSYVSSLPFCSSNVIHHFFCDSTPHTLFKLSCSDTRLHESIFSTFAGVNMVGILLVIFASYSYILFSIFRMHSGERRHKAFSTCASHLTAIILFYSTSIYTYLRPTSSYSLTQDKVASVFYTVVIPMLNPLIYSLRNKEVKTALWNVITRKPGKCCQYAPLKNNKIISRGQKPLPIPFCRE